MAKEKANRVVCDMHEKKDKSNSKKALKAEGHKAIGIMCYVSIAKQTQDMAKKSLTNSAELTF